MGGGGGDVLIDSLRIPYRSYVVLKVANVPIGQIKAGLPSLPCGIFYILIVSPMA